MIGLQRPTFAFVPVSPVPDSPRPRAALWLTGAAALALAVQAIFVLVPEPKSAGATDPAAPEAEAAAPLDPTRLDPAVENAFLPAEGSLMRPARTDSVTIAPAEPSAFDTLPIGAPAPRADTVYPAASPELPSLPADQPTNDTT